MVSIHYGFLTLCEQESFLTFVNELGIQIIPSHQSWISELLEEDMNLLRLSSIDKYVFHISHPEGQVFVGLASEEHPFAIRRARILNVKE